MLGVAYKRLMLNVVILSVVAPNLTGCNKLKRLTLTNIFLRGYFESGGSLSELKSTVGRLLSLTLIKDRPS